MQPTNLAPALNNRRTIHAWALFDWANSAYALVISVAIFPQYFLAVTPKNITILGQTISNSVLYTYAFSLTFVVLLIITPLLSGLADVGGYKKRFLRFFTIFGASGCLTLLFFNAASPWQFGTIAFMVATIGFAGGLVFYNAYLPEIASPDQYDRISARGFAYGYVGSVILLIVNLIVIQNYSFFGFSETLKAVPTAFAMVGLWWLGFSQLSFRRLPDTPREKLTTALIGRGWRELRSVWQQLQNLPRVRWFLAAYFFFNGGVQTVLYLATIFANTVLGFDSSELIVVVLLLQIVGAIGAVGFARVSERIGFKATLYIMLVLWLGVCLAAYTVESKTIFYGVAVLVGLVMSIQALSRSTYSHLLPAHTTDTASWFSFYDVVEKTSIIVGTFSFGLIEMLTGDMRQSILVVMAFFVVGFLLLIPVKLKAV
jgi:UMF1 family MFS transporter